VDAIVTALLNNPLFLAFCIVFGVFVLIAPLVLRAAGLSPEQIVSLLTQTLQFFLALLKEIRSSNQADK
jgi:hypothetical protein